MAIEERSFKLGTNVIKERFKMKQKNSKLKDFVQLIHAI